MNEKIKTVITYRDREDPKDDGARVEFFGWLDDCQGFVTVARKNDSEDDERVTVISPRQAIKLALSLLRWAQVQKPPQ